MVEISRGDVHDVARIMPIMNSAFDPQYGEAWTAAQCVSSMSLPYTGLWLAKIDDKICAFAMSRWILDEEELLMIGVDPDHRNRGIGRALVNFISEQARACLLYTSPSPRDKRQSRMPSSA